MIEMIHQTPTVFSLKIKKMTMVSPKLWISKGHLISTFSAPEFDHFNFKKDNSGFGNALVKRGPISKGYQLLSFSGLHCHTVWLIFENRANITDPRGSTLRSLFSMIPSMKSTDDISPLPLTIYRKGVQIHQTCTLCSRKLRQKLICYHSISTLSISNLSIY